MASGWISKKVRKAIYERDNCTCAYCGKSCKTGGSGPDYATLDHIVPQADLFLASATLEEFKAKQKDVRNLTTVCMACNSSKRQTALYVWCEKTGKDFYAIMTIITNRMNIALVK